ncbi:MAG TPA: imidazole glycerol phosphate synthase subunit HisH [Alphaproteobacteria bacterium]|nr:imidazole glycerol phosphate synthase subunit HisH [Alphaproteobacteria bacterium]
MAERLAMVDYGSGNLRSAAKAFERAAAERGFSVDVNVTSNADDIRRADRIVLPGVGAFGDCRAGLDALPGMIAALEESVKARAVPFLGICVGMQLMATRGLEHGEHKGLGWIGGTVAALAPRDSALKVPHMGWNDLRLANPPHPLFAGIPAGSHAYFVHSFALTPDASEDAVATVDYGGPVVAAVARDNMAGTQFHPEKSQALGLKLIANFLGWRP